MKNCISLITIILFLISFNVIAKDNNDTLWANLTVKEVLEDQKTYEKVLKKAEKNEKYKEEAIEIIGRYLDTETDFYCIELANILYNKILGRKRLIIIYKKEVFS